MMFQLFKNILIRISIWKEIINISRFTLIVRRITDNTNCHLWYNTRLALICNRISIKMTYVIFWNPFLRLYSRNALFLFFLFSGEFVPLNFGVANWLWHNSRLKLILRRSTQKFTVHNLYLDFILKIVFRNFNSVWLDGLMFLGYTLL